MLISRRTLPGSPNLSLLLGEGLFEEMSLINCNVSSMCLFPKKRHTVYNKDTFLKISIISIIRKQQSNIKVIKNNKEIKNNPFNLIQYLDIKLVNSSDFTNNCEL